MQLDGVLQYPVGIVVYTLYVFHDRKSTRYSKYNKRNTGNLETERQELPENEKEEWL